LDREPLSEPLKPAIYVVDTHIVVWFAEGLYTNLSWAATGTLLDPRTRIVIPSYVLQEIRNKISEFNGRLDGLVGKGRVSQAAASELTVETLRLSKTVTD